MHVGLSLDIPSLFIILRQTSCVANALVLLKKVSPSRRVVFVGEKRVKLDCRLLRSECKQHARTQLDTDRPDYFIPLVWH